MNPKQLIILSFAIAVLLSAAYVARHALLLIYISCIFAVVLDPAVRWVCELKIGRWHPNRGLAIVFIALAIAAVTAVIALFAFPAILTQLKDADTQLPDLLDRLQRRFGPRSLIARLNMHSISSYLTDHMAAVASIFGTIAGAVSSTATVVLLTAYLTLDSTRILRWSMSLLPPHIAKRLQKALHRAGFRIRRWITGQLMLMLILGSASAITFGAMGLRFFYLLALFAGLANFVPFLGPLATVVVAGSVAAVDSLWKALGVLIFYAVYQQVESAFLTPRIMQRQVKVSPSAVIVALLLGGALAGIPGAMVAVPSAVLVSVLITEYLIQPAQDERAVGRTGAL
jgi:predicted PurR-regulated permease PerM